MSLMGLLDLYDYEARYLMPSPNVTALEPESTLNTQNHPNLWGSLTEQLLPIRARTICPDSGTTPVGGRRAK